jgi:hypothetical protein
MELNLSYSKSMSLLKQLESTVGKTKHVHIMEFRGSLSHPQLNL